jgi:inner membrane protein
VATALSHAFVGALLGSGVRAAVPRWRLLALPAVLAVLPDLDVIAFALGIPYGHPLGHRGFSHSLLFAVLVAPVAVRWAAPTLAVASGPWWKLVAVCALACASHGVLDAMTDAGRGVGFFIPFHDERYFLPFRPIRTSPIGLEGFMARAMPILRNELVWIVLPCAALASLIRLRPGR